MGFLIIYLFVFRITILINYIFHIHQENQSSVKKKNEIYNF